MCRNSDRPRRQLPDLLPVRCNRAGEKLAAELESGFPVATKEYTGGSFFSRLNSSCWFSLLRADPGKSPAAGRLRCIKFNIPSRISGGSLR